MKKLVLLSIGLFFLTGCSATYDIEIYNNQIKEDMEFVNTDSSSWDSKVQYGLTYRDLIDSSVNYPYPVFYDTVVDEDDTIKLEGVEYYHNTLISDRIQLGQKLSYHKFTLDNFSNSSIVKKCYQYFNIIEEGDNIILSTSLKNLCFQEYSMLDNITVHLKTNHKVLNNNADIVDGYHYTWNLTRENQDDAAIMITLKKDEYVFNYENEFFKKIIYIGAFVGIIIGVSGLVYYYFKTKRRNSNEI